MSLTMEQLSGTRPPADELRPARWAVLAVRGRLARELRCDTEAEATEARERLLAAGWTEAEVIELDRAD